MYLKCLFICCLGVFSLCAERIEVLPQGTCNIDDLDRALKAHEEDLEVRECVLSSYPGLLKDKSYLGKLLKKLPFNTSIAIGEDVKKVVFMNVPPNPNKHVNLHKMPKEKMILFMWEPPLRLGEMYRENIQNCFSLVYTWDDDLVDNVKYFKFYYPELRPMLEKTTPFKEKKFCTMVIGHTCDKSEAKEELYSERKRAITFFESKGNFEFYGKNWDASLYPSYKGAIENKIEVIKNYRFLICYENSKGLKGYITEKIFDSFHAGVIPIYWGASNIEDYIPLNCFIDRRKFATYEELYTFLKGISEEEYENYLGNIRTYLKSEKAQCFSYESFMKIFCEAVRK